MAQELPQWAKITLVAVLVIFAAGLTFLGYRYVTAPVTLTVAAGSADGEAIRLMKALASQLPSTKSRIRLKVIEKQSALDAVRAFAAGDADLAIVRDDVGDLSSARTVVRLTQGVALIVAAPGAAIEDIDDLKGKTLGVVGGEVNHRLLEAIDKVYDLTRGKTRFIDLALADVPKSMQTKQVQALLLVVPVTEKYVAIVRELFPRTSKKPFQLVAIESAGAIAALHKAYESYDLPKGAIRGAPAIPEEDLTTVRVPFHLVANQKLDSDQVADLTKAIMVVRREMLADFPLVAQIAVPSTEKDAQIPIHPGAASYFDGEEKSFFDKYGDMLFYGSMALGSLTSLFLGAWKFMGFGSPPGVPLNPVYELFDRARNSSTEAELDDIEGVIDDLMKAELKKHAEGKENALDPAVLSLVANRLQHLVHLRKSALRDHHAAPGAHDAQAGVLPGQSSSLSSNPVLMAPPR